MRNLSEIKNRYFEETVNKRLGHLSSDLLRISDVIDNPKNTKIVNDIIEESKFFIEWTAPEAPFHIQEFLAGIQPKLALWQRHLLSDKKHAGAKEDLKRKAREWSNQLIKFSGLLTN